MNRLEKAAGHQTIPAADIVRQQKYRRILFVSSSDSVRGPMAAELLRNCDLKQEYVIGSAGMVVLFPEPANQKAEAIVKSAGMTLAEYSSRQFDQEDIQEDSLVLAIDEAVKEKITAEYGRIKNLYTLNEFAGDDTEIPDPYGQPLPVYGRMLRSPEETGAEAGGTAEFTLRREKYDWENNGNGSPADRT